MKRSTLFDIAFVVALAACSLYLGHLATVAYLRHVVGIPTELDRFKVLGELELDFQRWQGVEDDLRAMREAITELTVRVEVLEVPALPGREEPKEEHDAR